MKYVIILLSLASFASLVCGDLLKLATEIYSAAKEHGIASVVAARLVSKGLPSDNGYQQGHKDFIENYFDPCSRYLQQHNLISSSGQTEEQNVEMKPTDAYEAVTTVCKALFLDYSDILERLFKSTTGKGARFV